MALGECDMACTGATGENCGGANRILMYVCLLMVWGIRTDFISLNSYGQGPGPN